MAFHLGGASLGPLTGRARAWEPFSAASGLAGAFDNGCGAGPGLQRGSARKEALRLREGSSPFQSAEPGNDSRLVDERRATLARPRWAGSACGARLVWRVVGEVGAA